MLTETPDIEQIQEELNALQKFMEDLPDMALSLGIRVILALIIYFVGSKIISILRKILRRALTKMEAETGVVQFLDSAAKISLYFILFLVVLQNFGIDATGVIAILGSAGVTIGLALQGSLSNLAGGVLILVLKPFRVGDYILEGSTGLEGTVKEIGIFYTKLATTDNKIVVLPNGNLSNNAITNYSEAKLRRVNLTVGISYDADILKAKNILAQILEDDVDIDKTMDRLVFVDSLGASDVVLGLKGYCDNDKYWSVRWRITEEIKLAFDREGIEIPFQQIVVHNA